ncbi:MAG TPA: 16S rRNA (adenine(1518)-N(6)/adenine(1519)-N(6))-dimethyltransferase RsmA [Bauldia sp.]|nr:16S rRNA (adenine(1518)-N(6)/adenine(1519)-N(6))-dimethyltransferase RsmA [Bauldia sp.]
MSQIDGLPPLRDVIARHGIAAKKSLGQNFLLDLNLTARIARAAGRLSDATVIEVGPGPGGLTRALLAEGAAHVVAIERDERCLAALAEIAAAYPGRLTVVPGDALETDISALVPDHTGGRTLIVANLPYNIATPLLVGWLRAEPWPPWYESLTLMFQREVALRIVAEAGDDSYGRLAVLAGWRTNAEILFDIPARAFTPPPKVTSSVVQLIPKPRPLPCDPDSLERVVAAAFGQRRKMLRQSLKSLGADPLGLLAAAGIEGTRRAEEIDVAGFVALANAFVPPPPRTREGFAS